MKYTLIAAMAIFCMTPQWVQTEPAQWYLGLGGGSSTLHPDFSEVNSSVHSDNGTGGKVMLGRELTDHLSAELFYANLGEAELENGASVSYEYSGAAAMLNAADNNAGFSVFLKGGMAVQETTSESGPGINDTVQAFGGAGSELQLENGLTFRGEYEYFTEDASFLSFSVLKRLGNKEEAVLTLKDPDNALQTAAKEAPKKKVTVLQVKPQKQNVNIADADMDGVMDEFDKCAATPPGARVNVRGCPGFLGVVNGLAFAVNSNQLDHEAKVSLDAIAGEMLRYEQQQFVVVGHADSDETGDKRLLSLQRALQASKHLVSRGVPATRLRFAGFGQNRPRSDQPALQDRLLNRRIEIFLPGS